MEISSWYSASPGRIDEPRLRISAPKTQVKQAMQYAFLARLTKRFVKEDPEYLYIHSQFEYESFSLVSHCSRLAHKAKLLIAQFALHLHLGRPVIAAPRMASLHIFSPTSTGNGSAHIPFPWLPASRRSSPG